MIVAALLNLGASIPIPNSLEKVTGTNPALTIFRLFLSFSSHLPKDLKVP